MENKNHSINSENYNNEKTLSVTESKILSNPQSFHRSNSRESVYLPNTNLPMYRPYNLDGSTAVPRSPRRVMFNTNGLKSRSSTKSNVVLDVIDDYDDEEEIVVDPTHLDPYLQALAATKFKPWVFLFEWFAHIFMPLTVLLMIWTPKGRVYLRNRGFIGRPFLMFIQWPTYFFWIYLHVLKFVLQAPDFSLSELILIDALLAVRFLVVSTKYAYVSDLEYSEMMTREETAQQMNDRQVIAGWANPSINSVETQILLASVRQKVDLNLCWITAKSSKETESEDYQIKAHPTNETANQLRIRYEKFAKEGQEGENKDFTLIRDSAELKNEEQSEEGNKGKGDKIAGVDDEESECKFCAWDLIKSLILASNEIKVNYTLAWILTFLTLVIPSIVRAATGRYWAWGPQWYCYIGLIGYWILVLQLVISNFLFVLIAAMDTQRRDFLQKRLNAIAYDGYVIKPNTYGSTNERVRIDMNDPKHIMAWWYIRLVLQDYGLQFYKRINAYTGYFFLYSILLLVILFISAFVTELVDSSILFVAIINIFITLGSIMMVLNYGDETNQTRLGHALTMIRKRFDLETIDIVKSTKKKQQKTKDNYSLESSKRVLDTLIMGIKFDNEAFSVRFLGFKAGGDLVRVLIAILASGLAIVVRILLGLG